MHLMVTAPKSKGKLPYWRLIPEATVTWATAPLLALEPLAGSLGSQGITQGNVLQTTVTTVTSERGSLCRGLHDSTRTQAETIV